MFQDFKTYTGQALLSLLLIVTLACCGEPEFNIKGEIQGADDVKVEIEKSDFRGRWQPLDSTRTSPSGKFSVKLAAPAAPEIYRLHIGDTYVYLPADSTGTVTVRGDIKTLAREYYLDGSEQAVKMAEFDRSLNAAIAANADLTAFKRNVYEKYIRNSRGSILSYYVLTKTIGDRPLFDPADSSDLRYYAAVATAFKEFNPSDPRASYLEQTAIQALRDRNSRQGKRTTMEARELKLIEIALPDAKGVTRKLSDVAGKGKKTLLVFSVLTHPDSPLVNKILHDLRQSKGIDIYQVSLDADRFAWRQAAANLPWTNVFDPQGERSKAALDYNVSALPAFFIYDAQGNLIDRATTLDELQKKL